MVISQPAEEAANDCNLLVRLAGSPDFSEISRHSVTKSCSLLLTEPCKAVHTRVMTG